MQPNSSVFFRTALFFVAVLIGATGCATSSNSTPISAAAGKRPPTYALAVAVRGGVQPTPAQWNALYAKFSRALASRGLLLINDYPNADHIINVEFLPDPLNPDSGTAIVSSIVPNFGTYGRVASTPSTAYSASFASYNSRTTDPIWGYGYYSNDYFSNYANIPQNTTNPTPITPPTTPVVPPPHHRPVNPADCPPGTTPYLPPPSYVGNHPHHNGPRDGGYTPPSYSTRPEPSPSSSPSSSYSSNNDTSGRSSYSSPSNSSYSSSASSSYSAPSYSAPSYSASSGSSSSSSNSSVAQPTMHRALD